jgi:hypothetical protein
MSNNRDTTLYAEENPDPNALSYPFECIEDDYDMTPRPIIGHESAPIENFPKNIDTYYWTHEGENDGESWYCLCKLTNGSYVYYTARCDYTGFDCQGEMILWSSTDPAVLLQYAMGEYDYKLYRKECTERVM